MILFEMIKKNIVFRITVLTLGKRGAISRPHICNEGHLERYRFYRQGKVSRKYYLLHSLTYLSLFLFEYLLVFNFFIKQKTNLGERAFTQVTKKIQLQK